MINAYNIHMVVVHEAEYVIKSACLEVLHGVYIYCKTAIHDCADVDLWCTLSVDLEHLLRADH